MVETIVLADSKYLIPNTQHKNFTESNEVVRKGSKIKGDFKVINGNRKGQPFAYRVFVTNEGKILYNNQVDQSAMPATEVNLGVDSTKNSAPKPVAPAVVSIQSSKKQLIYATLVGAAIGAGYAKYKKLSNKELAKYAAIGAVGAYAIYWISTNKPTTKTSK